MIKGRPCFILGEISTAQLVFLVLVRYRFKGSKTLYIHSRKAQHVGVRTIDLTK
jgi:hypothetical protein